MFKLMSKMVGCATLALISVPAMAIPDAVFSSYASFSQEAVMGEDCGRVLGDHCSYDLSTAFPFANQSGSVTIDSGLDGLSHAQESVAPNPFIDIEASASGGGPDQGVYGASGQASLTYYFLAYSKNPSLNPDFFPATFSFNASVTESAHADLSLGNSMGTLFSYDSNSDPGNYNINQILELYTNTVYQIQIDASASASPVTVSEARADIDPLITIDPAYAADYVIEYSANIFGTAVPEPDSWVMMILGIGCIGAMMRRQRGLTAAKLGWG